MINYLLSAFIAVVLLTAHLFGLNGMYYTYDWYDFPMHIVGGVALGVLAYQLSRSLGISVIFSWKWLVVGVLCIGLAWEVFETAFGIAGAPVGTFDYYVDTVKDLINDSVGAAIGIFVASKIYNKIYARKNTQNI